MYIDAHNHMELYGGKLEEALRMIEQHQIITCACSTDEETYLFSKKLREQTSLIIPCFGIHPWSAHKYEETDYTGWDEYIKEAQMIGEIGLDFHWVEDKEKYPKMRSVFEYFLSKASEYQKLTNIHTKGAEAEVLAYLKKYPLPKPIIHWYSGPLNLVKVYIDYGCYFTVSVDAGISEDTGELIQMLPMDRILTETDGPTSLEWVNGEYGYPIETIRVVKEIAKIKQVCEEEMKSVIVENFNRLFVGGDRC